MTDPVTVAVVGWAVRQAGEAGWRGVQRLHGDQQERALRSVVRRAVRSAVCEVVPADQREVAQQALLLESPDMAEVEVSDVADLRGAIVRRIQPRLDALAEQGYEFDSARLAAALVDGVAAGIEDDATGGGPLGPLAERLHRERMAAQGETAVGLLETIDDRFAVLSSAARAPVSPRQPVGWVLGELAGPFTLGVHKAIDVGDADLPEMPAYVPRAHDAQLRQVVEASSGASGLTVLVGDSSTGKTRALWEAIRRLPTQWRLWFPPDARALNSGLASGRVDPRTVLWLDDGHMYLDPGLSEWAEDNCARLRELINDVSARPVLVVATLWPQNWQRLTAAPRDERSSDRAPGGPDSHARRATQVARLLEAGTYILVPPAFGGDDLASVRAAAEGEPRLAQAVLQAPDGRITQYLAGALEQLKRFDAAPDDVRAMIEVAIDACRLGHRNRLPERLLLEAAPGYLDDHAWDRLGDNWAAAALHAASVDWRGLDGPLRRIKPRPSESADDQPVYRLADVLEQTGARNRRYSAPPEHFWAAVARQGHLADVKTVADAARARGRFGHAADLYLEAANAGDALALEALALMLQETGDLDGAEPLAVKAAEAGLNEALRAVVWAREDAGDPGAAERVAARAADVGITFALHLLALPKVLAGNLDEVERLYRLAAGAGDVVTLDFLAQMREEAGDPAEAERLYQAAAAAGSDRAIHVLARMRKTAGDQTEAERVYQQFADAGHPSVLHALARMREEARDHAEAERLYRQAADADYPHALSDLARIREKADDHAEAEQLAIRAAEHGNTVTIRDLVVMRDDVQGRVEAERVAIKLTDAGHPGALHGLAEKREKAGDHAEAERLADKAAGAGYPYALSDLARMWEKAGDQVEAERLADKAAGAGHPGALHDLARTRDAPYDHTEAQRLALKAAQAGDSGALREVARKRAEPGVRAEIERLAVKTGDTIALRDLAQAREMAKDNAEAERLYRQAADAGDTRGLHNLAQMREHAGHHAEAERLYRRAADAGDTAALRALAFMRDEAGAHDEAERLITKAVNAGDTNALDKWTHMQDQTGNRETARQIRRYGLAADGHAAAPWTIQDSRH